MWKLVNLPSQYFPYGISSDTVVINVLKAYHFFHKISQNWHQNWPFNQYLRPSIRKFTIYDTPFRSILSQNWPNSRFDLITDDNISDTHCTVNSLLHMCFPNSGVIEKKSAGKKLSAFFKYRTWDDSSQKYHPKLPTYLAISSRLKFLWCTHNSKIFLAYLAT